MEAICAQGRPIRGDSFARWIFLLDLVPSGTAPNRMIYLCFVGGGVLAIALIALGIGLLRREKES